MSNTFDLFGEVQKPAFYLPTMAEAASADNSGVVVASTFSGAGGACLGWKLAGADVRVSVEFVDEARRTYAANFPGVTILPKDIRQISGADIVAAAGGRVDVLEGSPPCASFSMAGKREKHWGKEKAYSDTKQMTDDLIFEYFRLVREIRPRAFVMENVAGLTFGDALTEYLHKAIHEATGAGYTVDARVLMASHYGVAQSRRRLFVYGIRSDIGISPEWPTQHGVEFTVRDALEAAGESPADQMAAASMEGYAVGEEWKKLKPGGSSEKYFQLVRSDPDKPCQTITALSGARSAASISHPFECRKFTVRESLALSSFPLDFVLTGTSEQQMERIGRAVPPLLAKALAAKVISQIKGA